MPFDLSTAKPVEGGFDLASAIPGEAKPVAMTPAQKYYAGKNSNVPDSAMMRVLNGATFGFGDEMLGGQAAINTGIGNAIDYLIGRRPEFGMGDAYTAARDQAQLNASDARLQQEYPGASGLGLELIGGVAGGGAKAGAKAISSAPTIATRLARGAGVGALAGGTAGFGSGEGLEDRAKGAGTGALFGAGVGVVPPLVADALPVIGRVAGYGANAVKTAFHALTGKTEEEAQKILSPQELQKYKDMAVDYVKDLMEKSGKTMRDLSDDAALVQGKPVTGAEAIGPQGETQLASIARRSGTTGADAESFFRQRGEGRPERLKENLSKAARISTNEAGQLPQSMQEQSDLLRAANNPLYEQAYNQPRLSLTDPRIQELLSRPTVQRGIKEAQAATLNKGQAFNLTFDPVTKKWTGNPTWEDLDLIKRMTGSAINRAHSNGVGQFISDDISRSELGGLKDYRDYLFAKNPAYQAAVAKGGEPIMMEQAFSRASKLMDNSTTGYAFHKAINDMTPAELEATKSGWVNDIYQKLQSGKLRPKDLTQPVFMEKAGRLLGEPQARQFVDEVTQEMRLRGGEQRIPPKMGSATMGLQTAAMEHDQALDEGFHRFTDNVIRRGWPVAVLRAANDAYYSVMRAAKTPEQQVIRNEVGKLLMMKPDQLRKTLESSGGQKLNPKSQDLGKMILHLTTTVPNVGTQEAQQ